MAIPILGDLIGGLIGGVKDVVGEVVVDKDKRNQLNADLERLRLETEDKIQQRMHDAQIAQIAVNQEEAKSEKLFVAGWRPAAGWIGVFGLAYATVLQPISEFVARVAGYVGGFPEVNTELLVLILGGMLGLGTMKTFEKVKGVSSETIADPPSAARNVPTNLLPSTFSQPPEDAPWAKGEGVY